MVPGCVLCQILKTKGLPGDGRMVFFPEILLSPSWSRGSREKGDSRCDSERAIDSHSWVLIEAKAGFSVQA